MGNFAFVRQDHASVSNMLQIHENPAMQCRIGDTWGNRRIDFPFDASFLQSAGFSEKWKHVMTNIFRSMASVSLIIGVLASGSHALAQGSASSADTKTSSEAASCNGQQQDRAACLREMGAARQESQHGGLKGAKPAEEEKNALARCQYQPAAERADCEARIQGAGKTSVEGSVMGGGMLRETVTPVAPASR